MAFNIFPRFSRDVEKRAAAFRAELDALEISVAGRFSRGNIALQSECVLTAQALEDEREELRQKTISGARR